MSDKALALCGSFRLQLSSLNIYVECRGSTDEVPIGSKHSNDHHLRFVPINDYKTAHYVRYSWQFRIIYPLIIRE